MARDREYSRKHENPGGDSNGPDTLTLTEGLRGIIFYGVRGGRNRSGSATDSYGSGKALSVIEFDSAALRDPSLQGGRWQDQTSNYPLGSRAVLDRWGAGESRLDVEGFVPRPLARPQGRGTLASTLAPRRGRIHPSRREFQVGRARPFPGYKTVAERMGVSVSAYARKLASIPGDAKTLI